MLVAYCRLCCHCRNLAEGGCLLWRFHFTRCRHFLGHVACQNLPWQGLCDMQFLLIVVSIFSPDLLVPLFLFHLFPLFPCPLCYPCSPCFPDLLFPPVPPFFHCSPFPFFPLVPLFHCSPFFLLFSWSPNSLFSPCPPCSPRSPVPLVSFSLISLVPLAFLFPCSLVSPISLVPFVPLVFLFPLFPCVCFLSKPLILL